MKKVKQNYREIYDATKITPQKIINQKQKNLIVCTNLIDSKDNSTFLSHPLLGFGQVQTSNNKTQSLCVTKIMNQTKQNTPKINKSSNINKKIKKLTKQISFAELHDINMVKHKIQELTQNIKNIEHELNEITTFVENNDCLFIENVDMWLDEIHVVKRTKFKQLLYEKGLVTPQKIESYMRKKTTHFSKTNKQQKFYYFLYGTT